MCTDGVKVGKSFFFGGVRRQDQPRTDGDGNLEKPQQERQKHRGDKLSQKAHKKCAQPDFFFLSFHAFHR